MPPQVAHKPLLIHHKQKRPVPLVPSVLPRGTWMCVIIHESRSYFYHLISLSFSPRKRKTSSFRFLLSICFHFPLRFAPSRFFFPFSSFSLPSFSFLSFFLLSFLLFPSFPLLSSFIPFPLFLFSSFSFLPSSISSNFT